jgi:hypothetical protein
MIGSGALPSDHHPTGINPRRDGERIAFACWLRLPPDPYDLIHDSALKGRHVRCLALTGQTMILGLVHGPPALARYLEKVPDTYLTPLCLPNSLAPFSPAGEKGWG